MEQVLTPTDFAAARAVGSVDLKELGFVPVCMAPGAENDGHSHTLVEEVLIVQKGTGKIQIENETYDLCAGSVAIVPAGKFHAVCNTGNENLEGVTLFNKNVDRKKVVLKTRKQHFKQADAAAEPLRAELDATPGVRGWAPRIIAFALLSKETDARGVAVFGVDPEREPSVTTLKEKLKRGAFVSADRPNGIVLAERLRRDRRPGLFDFVSGLLDEKID